MGTGFVGFFLKLSYIFFAWVTGEVLTAQPDGLRLLQFCESSFCWRRKRTGVDPKGF